ncbi:hypothetical protein [Brachybacterium sp. YJGR34]|uniref:hypothetical protein n=1 Tax=Brachybacterium sp. YJGR34 TaxID=2059911 RepID=UPI000E0BA7B7|nr:hypothetical protein [Brachybacterium sp. YJGR34]
MRPDLDDAPDLVRQLLDMVADAHVVLLSEQGAGALASGDWARRVEEELVTRARHWTILRPSWFLQSLVEPRDFPHGILVDGVLRLPAGAAPIAWVDVRDIAAVAAEILRDPEMHDRAAYTVTGPDAVTDAQIAAELSAALGTPVHAQEPSAAILEGDEMLRSMSDLFARARSGVFAEVTDTVEQLGGRPPISLDAFVAEHRDSFATSPA